MSELPLSCQSWGVRTAECGPAYPFEPRSTAHVRTGDFWAIPTRRGGWFCCGRVLATGTLTAAPTRSLIVGLLDWCEPAVPTAELIAGRAVLAFGNAHIKTIGKTGGPLLGHRALEDDGLEAIVDPDALEHVPVWGYASIEELAHQFFGRHFPLEPDPATERPAHLGER